MKLFGIAAGSALAISLVGGSLLAVPVAAQEDCVTIYGGDVLNQTVIDLAADGGTAISDASGGSHNTAETGGRHHGDGSVTDIASAGNGGVATASANGGAISTGNINSGGNVGNAISVGDTHCAQAVQAEAPKKEAAPEAPKEERAKKEKVVALPETGVGIGGGDLGGLFALLTSAGAAAASFGLRRR